MVDPRIRIVSQVINLTGKERMFVTKGKLVCIFKGRNPLRMLINEGYISEYKKPVELIVEYFKGNIN